MPNRDFRKAKRAYWSSLDPTGTRCVSIGSIEFQRECDNAPKPEHGDRWGRWEYDMENKSLFHSKMVAYSIGTERMKNPQKLGEWVVHMAEKSWVTIPDLGNLVLAAKDINGLHW